MVRSAYGNLWKNKHPMILQLRDHCISLKGTERSRGRCLSKAGKDEAHQLGTHASSALHQGNPPPGGCVPCGANSLCSLCPGRQTLTWITETHFNRKQQWNTAEFRWGIECVRESNSPRQFSLKCSCTRPINSNWKGKKWCVIKYTSLSCLVCKLRSLVLMLMFEHQDGWDMTHINILQCSELYREQLQRYPGVVLRTGQALMMFKFNILNLDHIWPLEARPMILWQFAWCIITNHVWWLRNNLKILCYVFIQCWSWAKFRIVSFSVNKCEFVNPSINLKSWLFILFLNFQIRLCQANIQSLNFTSLYSNSKSHLYLWLLLKG